MAYSESKTFEGYLSRLQEKYHADRDLFKVKTGDRYGRWIVSKINEIYAKIVCACGCGINKTKNKSHLTDMVFIDPHDQDRG